MSGVFERFMAPWGGPQNSKMDGHVSSLVDEKKTNKETKKHRKKKERKWSEEKYEKPKWGLPFPHRRPLRFLACSVELVFELKIKFRNQKEQKMEKKIKNWEKEEEWRKILAVVWWEGLGRREDRLLIY